MSAANAQDKAVPDLFRPDPKLTFLETRGQLLPSEAQHVGLRVQAIDTFELRVRPVKPKDIYLYEDVVQSKHPWKLSWPLKIRMIRPRDSLTTWTAWLDLDHIARKFPGSFLEVKAIAGPRAYRPTTKEANCDSTWTMGRFLVSDLGVVATQIHPDSIQFQTFDLVQSQPWAGIELFRIDGPGKRYRTDTAGRRTIRDPDSSERWLARTTGSPSRIALVRLHDDFEDLFYPKRQLYFGDGKLPWTTIPGGNRLHPYVFRDLHIPGDTLVVGCLARRPSGISCAGQKLVWRLSTPSGRDIDSGSSFLDSSGHAQWRWPIPEKSWEHDYRIEASLGESRERIEIQVEERKIPRSSVNVHYDSTPSQNAPFGRLHIQANWNAGRPMADAFVRVRHEFEPIWGDYRTLWNPAWPWHERRSWVTNQEATTDSLGVAELAIPQPDLAQIGKVASLSSRVTVLEGSGYAIHAYPRIAPRTWCPRPALELGVDDDSLLHIKALWYSIGDSQIEGTPLSLSLRWESQILASRQVLSGQSWTLPISLVSTRLDDLTVTPRLTIVGCKSGTPDCVSEEVRVKWNSLDRLSWSPPEDRRSDDPDEPSIKPPDTARFADLSPRAMFEGDSAQVRWESSHAGFAWIRVLNGERILRSEFRPTRTGSNLWRVPSDSTWWPGVQIEVFDLSKAADGYDWVRNDAIHLRIQRKQTPLGISLQTDSVFHPNGIGHIRIHNPQGRKGSVVVSATDQAILDLTQFQMSEPAKTFEVFEAGFLKWWNGCGQRTRLYGSDESATCSTEPRVPGQFTRSFVSPPKPSDVECGGECGPRKDFVIPRFSTRPLAWVSPVKALVPGSTDFVIPLPAFLGNARLRAVISSGRDQVVLDTSVLVRSNLEGTLTTPFFLEPGDTTQAEIRVFGKPSLPGSVHMSTDGPLQLAAIDSSKLLFDSTGNALRRVRVIALSPHEARIGATLHQGSDSLELANEMDVRADRTQHTEIIHAAAVDGSITVALPRVFSDSGLRCRMEVSTGPILGLDRRIIDLLGYHHACLEQVVSKALPELFGSRLAPEGSTASMLLSSSSLRAALRKLQEFPRINGLIGLWPHSTQPDTFSSIWTAQFLASAPGRYDQGNSLEFGSLALAIASLSLADPTEEAWRLSLLPRLGFRKSSHPEFFADSTSLDSLSRLPLSREARWILASAWHHRRNATKAFAEMARARSTPDSLSRKSRIGRASRLRDQAWALEATMALSDTSERDRYLSIVARSIEGDVWLSTQEMGSLLVALAEVLPKLEPKKSSFVNWRTSNGAWKKFELAKGRTSLSVPCGSDSLLVRGTKDQPLLRLQTVREGALKSPTILRDSGFSLSVIVIHELPSTPSATFQEGDEFRLEVRIKNTSGQDLDNLAATTWLPAGWILRTDPKAPINRSIRHVDKRADRIVHHFDLAAGKETTLRIPLRALQAGSYHGPEVVVEALYDNALRGHWMGPRARVENR